MAGHDAAALDRRGFGDFLRTDVHRIAAARHERATGTEHYYAR